MIVQRALFMLGLCFCIGSINGVLAMVGGQLGRWLASPHSSQGIPEPPVIFLAMGVPILFWLCVLVPLCLQLFGVVRTHPFLRDITSRIWISAVIAGLFLSWIIGMLFIALPNAIGAIAGVACWPVLLLLVRKPLGWTVLCLILGGIFGYLMWGEFIRVDAIFPQAFINSAGLYFSIGLPALVGVLPVPLIFLLAPDAESPPQPSPYAHLCSGCDYDLRDLPDSIAQCPECGAVIPRA